MSSLKTILAQLPSKKRIAFLEQMTVANGKLININLADVPPNLTKVLMQATGCTTEGFACDPFKAGQCFKSKDSACDAASCKGNKGAIPATLGTLLIAIPGAQKRKYLSSIEYENGRLISASLGLLTNKPAEAAKLERHLLSV